MIVETRVTRLRAGENSSLMLGRFNVPAARFSLHTGDSGRNGRITMSGRAGITPLIRVYRQAACDSLTPKPEIAGRLAAYATHSPLIEATRRPPKFEHA